MHEWPLRRAAPQHLKVVVNARFGPKPPTGLSQRKLGCEGQGGELALPNDKAIPFSVLQDEP